MPCAGPQLSILGPNQGSGTALQQQHRKRAACCSPGTVGTPTEALTPGPAGKEVEASPRSLRSGDVAVVELVPTRPLLVEAFGDYPALGRFALRDLRQASLGLGRG